MYSPFSIYFLCLLSLAALSGCYQIDPTPCPDQTNEQSLMKTGLAAYMVSQGYYVQGCI